jgi:hypothetical protein
MDKAIALMYDYTRPMDGATRVARQIEIVCRPYMKQLKRVVVRMRLKIAGNALLSSVLALAVLFGIASAQTPAAPARKDAPHSQRATAPGRALEPRAIELLQGMSARLAAARTLSFTTVEIFEQPSRQGHPLAYATKSDVTLQRPDKLRVITSGDGPPSEFYYDGHTMMAYLPAEKLLAVADAPPTIDATLQAAYQLADIYFPFTDLIVADPYKDMSSGLMLAYYVGQSQVIGGTTTDIVAYADRDVFLQVWIGMQDKLPRLVHATFLADPERMRHHLEFSNWKLDSPVSADAFTAANASAAKRIPFARPQAQPAPGSKGPAKSTVPKG